jgi:hypothetical protein
MPSGCRQLHRVPHQPGVGDRVAVVAERDAPGRGQFRQFGQFFAGAATRDAADGQDPAPGIAPMRVAQRLDDRRGIRRRDWCSASRRWS